MRRLLLVGRLAVCVLLLLKGSFSFSRENERALTSMEEEILALANAFREDRGLTPLSIDPYVQSIAREHSTKMIQTLNMSHEGFKDRAKKIFQMRGALAIAENVAHRQSSAQEVFSAWLSSPGHRQNLEGRFNVTGISAIQDDKGDYFFTQIFVLLGGDSD